MNIIIMMQGTATGPKPQPVPHRLSREWPEIFYLGRQQSVAFYLQGVPISSHAGGAPLLIVEKITFSHRLIPPQTSNAFVTTAVFFLLIDKFDDALLDRARMSAYSPERLNWPPGGGRLSSRLWLNAACSVTMVMTRRGAGLAWMLGHRLKW